MLASRGDCESVVERRSIGPDVCDVGAKKLFFFRRAKASVAADQASATFQVAFHIQ